MGVSIIYAHIWREVNVCGGSRGYLIPSPSSALAAYELKTSACHALNKDHQILADNDICMNWSFRFFFQVIPWSTLAISSTWRETSWTSWRRPAWHSSQVAAPLRPPSWPQAPSSVHTTVVKTRDEPDTEYPVLSAGYPVNNLNILLNLDCQKRRRID